MGREIRRVPPDWQHPTEPNGECKPLFKGSWSESAARWDEQAAMWEKGLYDDYSTHPIPHWTSKRPDLIWTFEGWAGKRPVQAEYMPEWPADKATWLMMYENTTEGTPISPAFATPEELAHWLADNGASMFGRDTATYEQSVTPRLKAGA